MTWRLRLETCLWLAHVRLTPMSASWIYLSNVSACQKYATFLSTILPSWKNREEISDWEDVFCLWSLERPAIKLSHSLPWNILHWFLDAKCLTIKCYLSEDHWISLGKRNCLQSKILNLYRRFIAKIKHLEKKDSYAKNKKMFFISKRGSKGGEEGGVGICYPGILVYIGLNHWREEFINNCL